MIHEYTSCTQEQPTKAIIVYDIFAKVPLSTIKADCYVHSILSEEHINLHHLPFDLSNWEVAHLRFMSEVHMTQVSPFIL